MRARETMSEGPDIFGFITSLRAQVDQLASELHDPHTPPTRLEAITTNLRELLRQLLGT